MNGLLRVIAGRRDGAAGRLRRRLRDVRAAAAGFQRSRAAAPGGRARHGRERLSAARRAAVRRQPHAAHPGGAIARLCWSRGCGRSAGPDRLQAVILDASVKEEALETQLGVRGFLTTEAAARLERAHPGAGRPPGSATGKVLEVGQHGGRPHRARFPRASAMPSASGSATSSCAIWSTTSTTA